MRHLVSGFLVLAVAATARGQSAAAGDKRPFPLELRKATLRVGDPAPDFTLDDATGKSTVRLSKLKGKPVVLIFGSCT
jgi:cytochrome oxidase Cu insertion factor (SCO1/SenC/PrrC family)